jgi:membrane associated rhomboid family serine protease
VSCSAVNQFVREIGEMRSYYQNVNMNALWFLIALNFLIFIITLIRPGGVYELLGLSGAGLSSQPWTIVTNMFVHGGFTHILFNMISLFFLGRFVLQLVGEGRFLVLYLLGGIAGNILFLLLASPYVISVGASGAIYALCGTLVMLAPKLRVFIIPIPVPIPLWVAVIIFLLLSFVFSGIAWQAHLGGLLLGLGAGFYFKKRRVFFR